MSVVSELRREVQEIKRMVTEFTEKLERNNKRKERPKNES